MIVGKGVVTTNFTDDVLFVPPAEVTLKSYVPTEIPDGITTPVKLVVLVAVYVVIGVVPSTTAETVLVDCPPKKPVPVTATVAGVRLLPVFATIFVTVGAGVVTTNVTVDVEFVPPAAVTLRS